LRLCVRRLRLRLCRGRPLMKAEGRPAAPAAGLHAYRHADGEGTSRIHLRIEGDGHGLLS
jgi:hypothetical protein